VAHTSVISLDMTRVVERPFATVPGEDGPFGCDGPNRLSGGERDGDASLQLPLTNGMQEPTHWLKVSARTMSSSGEIPCKMVDIARLYSRTPRLIWEQGVAGSSPVAPTFH
jgi:hypothetical protein